LGNTGLGKQSHVIKIVQNASVACARINFKYILYEFQFELILICFKLDSKRETLDASLGKGKK
jgi:hypothetical protein